jgi:integrase
MARTPQGTPPSYPSSPYRGQARITVRLADGRRKDLLLGVYGSPESRAEYARVLAELEANNGRYPIKATGEAGAELTVRRLLLTYWRHVEQEYVKDGQPTSEQNTIKQALHYLRQLYGDTPAAKFGPLGLKAVRQAMIRHPVKRRYKVKDPITGKKRWAEKVERIGLARRFINKQIGRIKRMFAWAVEQELVPVPVYQSLLCVKGLKKGKKQAREKPRIGPVPETFIEKTLPQVPPAIRTMIQVQRLCGCRPQDVVQMRAIDIDMTGPVWEYRPPRYKTEHHNEENDPDRERVVYLGPKAQALLKPYLTLNVTGYLFSPKRSEAERLAKRHQERKTPPWESHQKYQERKRKARKRAPMRERYDVASYRRAIRRACLRAAIPIWFPLQLRHTRGTEIRKRYGLEASQAALGHRELGSTQVYAEVDQEVARKVMAEIG